VLEISQFFAKTVSSFGTTFFSQLTVLISGVENFASVLLQLSAHFELRFPTVSSDNRRSEFR